MPNNGNGTDRPGFAIANRFIGIKPREGMIRDDGLDSPVAEFVGQLIHSQRKHIQEAPQQIHALMRMSTIRLQSSCEQNRRLRKKEKYRIYGVTFRAAHPDPA